MAQRRFDADEDAERGIGRGIAEAGGARAAHMGGFGGDNLHVVGRDADVLGGEIGSGQPLHLPAEGAQQLGRLLAARVGDDHRLAAAEVEAGERVLVGHAARQAQRVGQRLAARGIGPHPAAAERRAEPGVMHRDDGLEAGGGIVTLHHLLVAGEFGMIENGGGVRRPVAACHRGVHECLHGMVRRSKRAGRKMRADIPARTGKRRAAP